MIEVVLQGGEYEPPAPGHSSLETMTQQDYRSLCARLLHAVDAGSKGAEESALRAMRTALKRDAASSPWYYLVNWYGYNKRPASDEFESLEAASSFFDEKLIENRNPKLWRLSRSGEELGTLIKAAPAAPPKLDPWRPLADALRTVADHLPNARWRGSPQPDTTLLLGINWSRDALYAMASDLETRQPLASD